MKSTGRYLWSLILSKLGKSGERGGGDCSSAQPARGRVVKADELPIRVGVKVVVGNLLQAAERSSTVCFTGAVIPQMSQLVRKVAGHPAS